MKSKFFKNVKIWYAFLFFILYMIICFLIPSLIIGDTATRTAEKSGDMVSEAPAKKQDRKITLLLTESQKVVELDLEDYLKGVLIGEVPVTYEMEALKAQAVVARTYTMNKLKNAPSKHAFGADMCDDINCCQAYKTKEYAFASWDDAEENEKWARYDVAVNETKGNVIVYHGELINAFFHAHSGGKTENVKYLWSKTAIPYLVSVDGNEGMMRQDSLTLSKEEFLNLLKEDVTIESGDFNVVINDYTGSGRVNTLQVNGTTIEATRLRALTGIKSTNFRVEMSGDTITFYTVGYGHGVGMSQEGANQMAKEGKNYTEIIKHYYTGVEIVQR